MVNIFAPSPSTYPSDLNSIAGEAISVGEARNGDQGTGAGMLGDIVVDV